MISNFMKLQGSLVLTNIYLWHVTGNFTKIFDKTENSCYNNIDYDYMQKGGQTMALGIHTGSGEAVRVIVPTRYYAGRSDGLKYPMTAVADFLADAGFDGADVSLELVAGLEEFDNDDGWRSVIYRFGNRAAARGHRVKPEVKEHTEAVVREPCRIADGFLDLVKSHVSFSFLWFILLYHNRARL